jgi:hypothetical protein
MLRYYSEICLEELKWHSSFILSRVGEIEVMGGGIGGKGCKK